MNAFEFITIIVQTLSTLAIVVTMLFIYLQLRSSEKQSKISQKTLEQSTYLQVETNLLELSKVLVDNPEVVSYLYENNEIESLNNKELYQKAFGVCLLYLDLFDHVLTVENQFPGVTDWSKQKWADWILDVFQKSPMLRQIIKKEKDWYKEELFDIVNKIENRES